MDIQLTNEDRLILLTNKIMNFLSENIEGLDRTLVIVSNKEEKPEFFAPQISIYPMCIVGVLKDRELVIDYREVSSVKMSEETFKLKSDKNEFKTAREIKSIIFEKFPEIKDETMYEQEKYLNSSDIKSLLLAPNAKVDAMALDVELDDKKPKVKHSKI